MTYKRKISLLILAFGVLFLIFGLWYKYEYSMDTANEFEVNSPEFSPKLLIATQGSAFKDEITNGVVNYYEKDSVYIKVIDVSALVGINPTDFNAILLIHTWENWQPPENVESFINRTSAIQDKIIVLTTSGEGSYKMEGVDAITGESKLKDASSYIDQITKRLEFLLNLKSI